jgi:hypothetical protein
MKNWSRERTVDLIFKIEENEDLLGAKVNDVLIWPWIRVKLFFLLLRKLEGRGKLINKSLKPKRFSQLKSSLIFLNEFFRLLRNRKSKFLFVGEKSHRAHFNGVSFNKFFDPIRKNVLNECGVLVEYSFSTKDAFLKSKNLSYAILKKYGRYFFRYRNIDSKFWKNLEISLHEINTGLSKEELHSAVIQLKSQWKSIIIEKEVWNFILRILKPEKIFTLCYYSNPVYSLNIAANELKIPTIEMQHGPINAFHLAYGSFKQTLNQTTSALLPQRFLAWDSFSLNVLSKSFPTKEINILGLPWLNFLSTQNLNLKTDKKIILYALQPISEIGEAFPDFLIKWIKQSKESFMWYIRLHPRQDNEREYIVQKLQEAQVYESVEIERASNLPLPLLMSNSHMIFTSFSGVVIEAASMGIPSVTFHPNALIYYKDQLNSKSMYYFDRSYEVDWQELNIILNNYFDSISSNLFDSFDIFKKLYL